MTSRCLGTAADCLDDHDLASSMRESTGLKSVVANVPGPNSKI